MEGNGWEVHFQNFEIQYALLNKLGLELSILDGLTDRECSQWYRLHYRTSLSDTAWKIASTYRKTPGRIYTFPSRKKFEKPTTP